jgi:cytochrome c biogenesis factor
MLVELGHYALVLAFALTLVVSVVPLWGALKGDGRLMAVAHTGLRDRLLSSSCVVCGSDRCLRCFGFFRRERL